MVLAVYVYVCLKVCPLFKNRGDRIAIGLEWLSDVAGGIVGVMRANTFNSCYLLLTRGLSSCVTSVTSNGKGNILFAGKLC